MFKLLTSISILAVGALPAAMQFPSVGDVIKQGPKKPKPPRADGAKTEQPNSDQGTSFRKPDAPKAASQGITSEMHRKYLGRIVFSGADMPLDQMNEGMLKSSFRLGDEIYYRVYMAEPAPTQLYGKVPGVDDHNTAYFTQYKMLFTVDGRPYEVSQRPWGTADEYKEWTTWRGQLLSRGDRFFPGQESFGELLSRATRKADLGPGTYKIGVELIPVVIINEGTGGVNNFVEKARAPSVAKGEFTLTVTASSYAKTDKKICGHQAVQSDSALEKQILSKARSIWTRPDVPPVKVRITHGGWTITRHPITGIILDRRIDAAILSRGPHYCDIQGYSYSQAYVGGNFSAANAKFAGAETYGTYIPCSCLD